MENQTTQICLDSRLSSDAAELYENLGLDLTTAIQVFLKKSLSMGGFPFNVRYDTPDGETLAAAYNTLNGVNLSREFHSVAELMEDLNADD